MKNHFYLILIVVNMSLLFHCDTYQAKTLINEMKDKEGVLVVIDGKESFVDIFAYGIKFENDDACSKKVIKRNRELLSFGDRANEVGDGFGIRAFGKKGELVFEFQLAFPFCKNNKYFSLPWDSTRGKDPVYFKIYLRKGECCHFEVNIIEHKVREGLWKREYVGHVEVVEVSDYVVGRFDGVIRCIGDSEVKKNISGKFRVKVIDNDSYMKIQKKIWWDTIMPLLEE